MTIRETLAPVTRFDIAAFGELLGDPSRVAILLALMDGSARPATELASVAGVTRSTASSHLGRLLDGGLVAVEQTGRHRYFRLANDHVADALESVMVLAPASRDGRPRVPRLTAAQRDVVDARTCYRHLAGRLGVAWLASLERGRFVGMRDGAFSLTRRGERWLASVSGAPSRSQASASMSGAPSRSPAGKPCLDWTERRHHLGGALGSLLTEQLFAMKWIARREGSRGVRVTARGATAFDRDFALRLPLAK